MTETNDGWQEWDLFGDMRQTDPALGMVTQGLLTTHGPAVCAGQACCLHSPSDHPLAGAPLLWRADRGLMERTCKHGMGHPDPDDLAHKQRTMPTDWYDSMGFDVHGCDGCCRQAAS
jgi:hypothetical protein